MRIDPHGDAREWERLYALSVGHVITEQDVKDIQNLIADFNDEIGEIVEGYTRQKVLHELGGQMLVDAVNASDLSGVEAAIQTAMKKYHAVIAARLSK